MTEQQKNTVWEIVFDTDGLDTYAVTAAYTSIDERVYPGWTLLRDQTGAITAKVRSARVLMIRRSDANPYQNVQRRMQPQMQQQAQQHVHPGMPNEFTNTAPFAAAAEFAMPPQAPLGRHRG